MTRACSLAGVAARTVHGMTAARASGDEDAVPSRSWSLSLLAETEPGRRNRRLIDAASLLLAAIVIGLTAVVASSAKRRDEDVAQALQTVLAWADSLWRLAFVGPLLLAVVVALDVLLQRRWSLARDLLVAALLAVAAGFVLHGVVEPDWVPTDDQLLSNSGYPELRLATATAILVVVAPELVRWVRLAAAWTLPFATVGVVVLGAGLPSGALGALALGLARARGARGARRRDRRAGAGHSAARRLCRVCRPRRPGFAQGATPRPRRAGFAATRPALAPSRLPRPTSERAGGAPGAGRA